jgi:hypothetical protein
MLVTMSVNCAGTPRSAAAVCAADTPTLPSPLLGGLLLGHGGVKLRQVGLEHFAVDTALIGEGGEVLGPGLLARLGRCRGALDRRDHVARGRV